MFLFLFFRVSRKKIDFAKRVINLTFFNILPEIFSKGEILNLDISLTFDQFQA